MAFNTKDYPKNWKEIVARINKRAGNCCEFCKVPNHVIVLRGMYKEIPVYQFDDNGKIYSALNGTYLGESYVGDVWIGLPDSKCRMTKIILTTAHLDHDKLNHQVTDDRLKALCQRCHLLLDMDYHVAKRKENRSRNQTKLF